MMAADPTLADGGGPAGRRGLARRRGRSTDAIAEQQEAFAALGGYFAERAADLADIRDRAVARLLGRADARPARRRGSRSCWSPTTCRRPTPRCSTRRPSWRSSPAAAARRATRRSWPGARPPGGRRLRGRARPRRRHAGVRGRHHRHGGRVSDRGRRGDPARRPRGEKARLTRASPAPAAPATATRCRCCSTWAARRTCTANAEGVGLFRTEFLFLGRTTAPTVEEQERGVRGACSARSARARSWCARWTRARTSRCRSSGSAEEDNPALGVRGLRIAARPPGRAGRPAGGGRPRGRQRRARTCG